MWATVYLIKDGDQFKRVLRDMCCIDRESFHHGAEADPRFSREKLYRLTDQRDRTEGPLKSYSLFDQGIHKQVHPKMYVFTGSALCLGGECQARPRLGEIWEQEHIASFVESGPYHKLFDLAGEPVVLEWRIYPGHICSIPRCASSFLLMCNDIDWNQQRNEDPCRQNTSRVSAQARCFPTGCGTFLGLEMGKSGMVPSRACVKKMKRVDTRCFVAQAPLPGGTLQSKDGGKNSVHHNASADTAVTVENSHCRKSAQYSRS